MRFSESLIVAAATLFVISSPALATSGGGVVNNTAATVVSLTSQAEILDPLQPDVFTQNVAFQDSVSGVIEDRNGEKALKFVTLTLLGPGGTSTTYARAITSDDIAATTPPTPDSDGFAIWNSAQVPGQADGQLSFTLAYEYSVLGDYVWTLSVSDSVASESDDSDEITVRIRSALEIPTSPINADGTTATHWGGWVADPGAANVRSNNFLLVKNTGINPDQGLTVSFNANAFLGADGTTPIDILANIEYLVYATDLEQPLPSSSEGEVDWAAFTTVAANEFGALEYRFTQTDQQVYIAYSLLSLPPILADQSYLAGLTISELADA